MCEPLHEIFFILVLRYKILIQLLVLPWYFYLKINNFKIINVYKYLYTENEQDMNQLKCFYWKLWGKGCHAAIVGTLRSQRYILGGIHSLNNFLYNFQRKRRYHLCQHTSGSLFILVITSSKLGEKEQMGWLAESKWVND